MDKLFVGWDFVFIYLDDILIASRAFPEHVAHLKSVLERLQQAGLRVKPLKCAFTEERLNIWVLHCHLKECVLHRRILKLSIVFLD